VIPSTTSPRGSQPPSRETTGTSTPAALTSSSAQKIVAAPAVTTPIRSLCRRLKCIPDASTAATRNGPATISGASVPMG
jgi:hypothetical protein